MRKSHRADRRHRETRPLDRGGGSAGRRHAPAGCARRAPAEELSRACKQRPPTSAARSSSGPAPHLEGTAPAGPHRCPGAVVGAPPGPDGRAAPAEGAPRRRAGPEGEQPGLRAAELHARQRHPAAATEEGEPRRGGGSCRARPAGKMPAKHTRTPGGHPRRPPGTRGAARCTTSLLEAHFAAALWAAPLDSFAYSAPLGHSQEASGTALEPP